MVYKIKGLPGRYATDPKLFYATTPNYGYTKADAEKVEKLAKKIVDCKAELEKLWNKAKSEDKRYG